MIVGLLAMLFIIVTTYITLAQYERITLRQVSEGDLRADILDSVNEVLFEAIRGSDDGVSGPQYATIPGYGGADDDGERWGTYWLASSEPVRDMELVEELGDGYAPLYYRYPGLTSVGEAPAVNMQFAHYSDQGLQYPVPPALMRDGDEDTDAIALVVPGDTGSNLDTLLNVRFPWMDSDGDGIADSSFSGSGLLTELANAMTGRSVSTSGVTPWSVPSGDLEPGLAAWQQYNRQARYDVAGSVLSHGGMVQIALDVRDPDYYRFNSAFSSAMFNWVKHTADGGSLNLFSDPTDRELGVALAANRGTIEPMLRHRGGTLLPAIEDGTNAVLPDALFQLHDRFGYTFRPYVHASRENRWEPFNLGDANEVDENEWDAWRKAKTIDAASYNDDGDAAREYYNARQLITTTNYSDELARINGARGVDPDTGLGLRPGATKFYLGRITDRYGVGGVEKGAFRLVANPDGASHWVFNDEELLGDGGWSPAIQGQGHVIIYELAQYYNEMLYAHEWALADDERRDQAFMLAVNTVAFAAPRDENGFVDVVYYPSYEDVNAVKRYYGYGPQPFITQTLVYNQVSQGGIGEEEFDHDIGIAIELYNPNESANGTQDLYLPQFALSLRPDAVNDQGLADESYLIRFDEMTPGQAAGGLQVPERFPGRSFMLFSINDGGNSTFDAHPYTTGIFQLPLANYDTDGEHDEVHVCLWRRGRGEAPSEQRWHLVDQMVVDLSVAAGVNPENPEDPEPEEWWANVYRDTAWEWWFGEDENQNPARWRMVMDLVPPNWGQENGNYYKFDVGPEAVGLDTTPGLWATLGTAEYTTTEDGQDVIPVGPSAQTFEPSVPLYTMNASLRTGLVPGKTLIHGSFRPNSFPTVGFLLFVPRFSHYMNLVNLAEYKPLSTVLFEHWEDEYDLENVSSIPCDFGHMPVFYNQQDVDVSGGFDIAGKIPWGQLVFDYFTTINPYDADGDGYEEGYQEDDVLDPYRIGGRININTAPWYALAGLPLIGPGANFDLPLDQSASPAFWDADLEVLTSALDEDQLTNILGVSRVPPYLIDSGAGNGQWYRLGPQLAQAAVEYRDRIKYAYTQPGEELPFLAHDRPRSRQIASANYYGAVRGANEIINNKPAEEWQRGFLTIGELANVLGFDSSTGHDQSLLTHPPGMVLFGYGDVASRGGDYFKAVSLLALLDTQFLTTRSNTYTVYASLMDRENPQSSMRSQVTIDRTNQLPRLVWTDTNQNGHRDPEGIDSYQTVRYDGPPEQIGRREVSYFNARYDY